MPNPLGKRPSRPNKGELAEASPTLTARGIGSPATSIFLSPSGCGPGNSAAACEHRPMPAGSNSAERPTANCWRADSISTSIIDVFPAVCHFRPEALGDCLSLCRDSAAAVSCCGGGPSRRLSTGKSLQEPTGWHLWHTICSIGDYHHTRGQLSLMTLPIWRSISPARRASLDGGGRKTVQPVTAEPVTTANQRQRRTSDNGPLAVRFN